MIVAVDIEVSNSGMPVNAPTKLFKLFEEESVFNDDDDDLFVEDLFVAVVVVAVVVVVIVVVVVVVGVVALKVEDKGDKEEDGVTSNPVTATSTHDPPAAWSGEGVGEGMIQGLIFSPTKRSI